MFKPIELPKIETSLTIPEYFASIVGESESHYSLALFFNISKSDLSKHNLSYLKIKFFRKNYKENIKIQNNSLESSATRFLTKELDAVKRSSLIKQSVIVEDIVYLFQFNFGNDGKRRIKKEIITPIFEKQLRQLRSEYDDLTLKDKNLSVIKILNVDPADAILSKEYESNNLVNSLKNHYLFFSNQSQSKEKYYGVSEINAEKTKLYIKRIVDIPKEFAKEPLEISFEPYSDKTNIQKFENRKKELNIQDLISIKNSRIKKPAISAIYTKNFAGLRTQQEDEKASGILLQKKTINTSGQITKYSNIFKNEEFKKNSIQSLPEPNIESEVQLYRCVAFNSSFKNQTSYRNIIAGSIPFIDTTVLLLRNNSADKTMEISLHNPPVEAEAFQILKRRLEAGGLDAYGVEQPITEFLSVKPTPEKVIDADVISGHLYEYSVKYKLKNGIQKHSVRKIYKFVDPTIRKSLVAAEITSPTINQSANGPAVTFNISTRTITGETNLLKTLISRSGVSEEFLDEFKKLKDNYEDFIFFKVVRTNLSISPGIEEEFKDIFYEASSQQFVDDTATRKNSGVADLNPSHDYLYEVRAYFKNPASLLREYVKTVQSQIKVAGTTITKSYKYKPYKWLQQKTLDTGTLISEDANGNLAQVSFVEDGDIGVIAQIKIDKLEQLLQIKTATAKRIEMNAISINWTFDSSLENYDHFVIVKESNGERKILATTINSKFIDSIMFEDAGTIIYYITPVFNDYSVGNTVKTKAIVIDPEEFDSYYTGK
jgi:hypothetical protein